MRSILLTRIVPAFFALAFAMITIGAASQPGNHVQRGKPVPRPIFFPPPTESQWDKCFEQLTKGLKKCKETWPNSISDKEQREACNKAQQDLFVACNTKTTARTLAVTIDASSIELGDLVPVVLVHAAVDATLRLVVISDEIRDVDLIEIEPGTWLAVLIGGEVQAGFGSVTLLVTSENEVFVADAATE